MTTNHKHTSLCPLCHATYGPPLEFCLADGTALVPLRAKGTSTGPLLQPARAPAAGLAVALVVGASLALGLVILLAFGLLIGNALPGGQPDLADVSMSDPAVDNAVRTYLIEAGALADEGRPAAALVVLEEARALQTQSPRLRAQLERQLDLVQAALVEGRKAAEAQRAGGP